MNKFLITEEEKNRILNLHRLRSKNQYLIFESDEEVDVENFVPKTRAEVMALQQAILYTESDAGKIKDNDGKELSGENDLGVIKYQGRSSVKEFSGSSLCNGFCNVRKAVDGIYGPRTKKAFEEYKENGLATIGDKDKFKEYLKALIDDVENKYQSSVNDWRIPASKDAIKAFQYFIWKAVEDGLEKTDPNCEGNDCEYNSMLCGGNPCKFEKAVDGFWGPNTKRAWNEYNDEFLDNFSFYDKYEKVKTMIKDNLDIYVSKYAKKYDKKPEDEKETDDNKDGDELNI